jgi:DNA-binding transcriptional regulator YiaG
MKRKPDLDGDVFHPPKRRPMRGNPMEDPLVWTGKLAKGRARLHLRARDRREFEPMDIREIRNLFGQSRRQFAQMMGISRETLRNWELGRRFPQGPARSLLRIARANPDVVASVLVLNRAPWARIDPDGDW